MAELSKKEFWVVGVYFMKFMSWTMPHELVQVQIALARLHCETGDQILQSLIDKNVLSLSPDGHMVRLTDYGAELYASMSHAQQEWESQPIIRVSNIQKDEILVRAGEHFKANRILREIFSLAKAELCILDPYIGAKVFDLIQDAETGASVRIITSDQTKSAAIIAYGAFKAEYGKVEMRLHGFQQIHDRFVLWDKSHGFHVGHSMKDLGTKDTQLNRIANPAAQLKLFEERWRESTPVA
ncbi:MAG: hypothetical protein ABSA12_00230 [Verrucomicrobiia bacterium]|jgi:hypothetical protein